MFPNLQICAFCTLRVWRGPGDDAPHQAAVEQDFPGEAVVFAEMLQVTPHLVCLTWRKHGWRLAIVKYSVQLFARTTTNNYKHFHNPKRTAL